MSIITIQITDEQTLVLLRNLEQMKLLRVLKEESGYDPTSVTQLVGKLSAIGADRLLKHIEEDRSSWNNRI